MAFKLAGVLFLVFVFSGSSLGQEEFATRIPDKLVICYENKTITDRFSRLALSMDNLIALIRKVEQYPDTSLWTSGKLAGTILKRFRYDGVTDAQNPAAGVLPVERNIVENEKYHMIWSLVPGYEADFPEDALTTEEKCSLHWMLSYSINATVRSEELRKKRQVDPKLYFEDNSDQNRLNRKRRQVYQPPRSNRPTELGVVSTKWGTVAAGSVLAGIATGIKPETIQLRNLIRDPAFTVSESSLSRTIESPWAVTLPGDIAQSALLRASRASLTLVGPRGSWNSTTCSREYYLTNNDPSLLTTAEIYGGIDGLLLATSIRSWNKDYMKLSSILEMYYSEEGIYGDRQYRACNRLNVFKDRTKIDPAMLKDQALNAALAYYAKGLPGTPSLSSSVRPADGIGVFINSTVQAMANYLSNSAEVREDFIECSGDVQLPAEPVLATSVDVTFVMDQYNDDNEIRKQKDFAAAIALQLDVRPGGSRLEVVSSRDGSPFVLLNTTQNKAELACRITNADIRYSDRRLSEVMAATRVRIIQERNPERLNYTSGSNARVILFFVGSYTPSGSEKDKMKEELAKLRTDVPDIRLMFATYVSPEEFRPFVLNFEKDIIRMSTYTTYVEAAPEIAKRLSAIPARIAYPACADAIAFESSYVYRGYLKPRTSQYFRLGPEFFHSSANLKLKFQFTYGTAMVCTSRDNTTKGQCITPQSTGETVEVKFERLCNWGPVNCDPVYVLLSQNVEDSIPCSDRECSSLEDTRFTITHEGMRCSASVKLISTLMLFAALFSSILNRFAF